jgi:hypothetical protein
MRIIPPWQWVKGRAPMHPRRLALLGQVAILVLIFQFARLFSASLAITVGMTIRGWPVLAVLWCAVTLGSAAVLLLALDELTERQALPRPPSGPDLRRRLHQLARAFRRAAEPE